MEQNANWFVKTIDGQLILVDENEYKIASKYQWQSKADGRGGHRPVIFLDGRCITFASVVFELNRNQVIYHKNGNPYDFRRDKIVICNNRSEFGHYIGSSNRKNTQYKGVFLFRRSNAWAVRIIKDKNIIDGGHFASAEDASIVADYFIIKNYGENTDRNYPELSFKQINEKYISILTKYGHDSNARKAKSGQGLTRCGNKTSRFVGVSKDKSMWTARIKFNKKQIHLGNFETEEVAAQAYDKKAIELYGELAKLNFPANA